MRYLTLILLATTLYAAEDAAVDFLADQAEQIQIENNQPVFRPNIKVVAMIGFNPTGNKLSMVQTNCREFIQTRGHYIQSLKLHEILGIEDLEIFRITVRVQYKVNNRLVEIEIPYGETMDLQ